MLILKRDIYTSEKVWQTTTIFAESLGTMDISIAV
jgi:hypothetical protein